ncbi:hypothetical protein SAMN05216464_112142 [Mucilaginibacter pineti]|uniref:Putative auto-transporter adhesin head GIN domain-containing protein n=1 Tax=Mucilaginibacter pineti TaxID=1391627 RepID=A0A1G7I3T0_9SPHI|nr:DUF2807 domain-containing protein [Mucilaginibacter pineti]SDF07391.1 hypothetical protein SAMN05216464_112142 [Mucilaginibacter pineti]
MKSTLFTIITSIVLVGGLTNSTFATTNNNNAAVVATVLNDVKGINKIEIRGNVQLYVSAGQTDQVKVYNRYYGESALVQNQKGVLRITSYKAEKLVVWVTANDLRAITAYDNSEVKSFGNLSIIDLDVNLHNNATANLNLDAYNANINVTDHAKIELSGTATQYNLNHNAQSSVNSNKFVATNYTDKLTNGTAVIKENDELAGL